MFKHLKNQSGLSFMLMIMLVGSIVLMTVMSIGYKMFEWSSIRKSYQMKIDAIAVFEDLAVEVNRAYSLAQTNGISLPAHSCAALPWSPAIYPYTTVRAQLLSRTALGEADHIFCFPDPFCIQHPNPPPNSPGLQICMDNNSYDGLQRLQKISDFGQIAMSIVPPKGLWNKTKFKVAHWGESLGRVIQNIVHSFDNTAVAQFVVPKPVITAVHGAPMNRSRGAAVCNEANKDNECYVCGDNIAGTGNLACIMFRICLKEGGCNPAAGNTNDGWFQQVIGVKRAN